MVTYHNLIIVGDTNLNLLNKSNINKRYYEALASNGYFILNKIDSKFATRVASRVHDSNTSTSRTIIDHFLTDRFDFSLSLSFINSDLSDHKQALLSFDNHNHDNFLCIQETQIVTKINKVNYESNIDEMLTIHDSITSLHDLIEKLDNCKNISITHSTHTNSYIQVESKKTMVNS